MLWHAPRLRPHGPRCGLSDPCPGTSVVAFAVWVAAFTLSLTFAVLIVGIPIVIGSAFVMRWTAELDRRNAALVFGRPVRGAYRSHRGSSFGGGCSPCCAIRRCGATSAG